MSYMFSFCQKLISINLSNFNTQNVKDLQNMFYGDSSLINIDLSSFNTQNLAFIGRMFYNCNSLTSLNISNFDTSKIRSLVGIFSHCNSLNNIDIRNFNSKSLINVNEFIDMIFNGKPSNGIVYYNSNLFDKELIDNIFVDWEKIDIRNNF